MLQVMPLPEGREAFSGTAWFARLEEALQGPTAVLTLGNRLHGDDAVGPEIYDRLEGRCRFALFEGGLAPENFLGPLLRLRPREVLLVDAVHFAGSPGETRLFQPEQLAEIDISTHAASPKLLLQQLEYQAEAIVYLLGIQPKQRMLGQSLSDDCRGAAETISRALIALSER